MEREIQRGHGGGAGRVRWWRDCAFLFQVLLKSTLTHGEGRPRRFPPNNEQVGRGVGGSQPGEGGLGHPTRAPNISCLKFPERQYSKKFFFGKQYLLRAEGVADRTYKGKLSLLFLSLGTHLDTRCLNYCPAQLLRFCMEIWVSHGTLICL
jgi:hypothetical protein